MWLYPGNYNAAETDEMKQMLQKLSVVVFVPDKLRAPSGVECM